MTAFLRAWTHALPSSLPHGEPLDVLLVDLRWQGTVDRQALVAPGTGPVPLLGLPGVIPITQ